MKKSCVNADTGKKSASLSDEWKDAAIWLSYKEHQEDALALGAEEGRDKLRKAAVRSTYP